MAVEAEASLLQVETLSALAAATNLETASEAAQPVVGGEYQEMAGNILAQLVPGRPAVLMFTSPGDGHGKTTILVRLAPALAQRVQGEVLLVDANVRHPDLAAQFGLEATCGLSDVLRGTTTWSDAVRPTAVPRLSLLPGGRVEAGESTAIERSDPGPLFGELSRRYALILVDAASLAHPEAASIVRCSDSVYLVTRLGQSTARLVREAAQAIQGCRGRLAGCIAVA